MSTGPFFDAHNHFQDAWLEPHQEDLLRELPVMGLAGAVVNGSCVEDWPSVSKLCLRAPWLHASYGLHPWDCGNRPIHWFEVLEARLLAEPQAFVGEMGLDRWILDRAAPDDPRLAGLRRAPLEEQTEVCRLQLALAARLGRPASVHCLDAFGPLLELLQHSPRPSQGFLLHAYSGPPEMVPAFAELGAYFSFNGAFLEPRKKRVRAAFMAVPLERLLVETDAPAMQPPGDRIEFTLPHTAQGDAINHPGNIRVAYAGLSELRALDLGELCAQCRINFERLFVTQ